MSLRSLMDPGDWLATKPKMDPTATPVEFHFSPDPLEVKARLIVGLGVAAVASLAAFFYREELVALIVTGGFGSLGLMLAVYGVLQSRFSMSVVISGLEVSVQKHSIWGVEDWRETLHRYQGILLREEEFEDQSSGKIRRVKRYGIVELVHAEPAKNVVLYVREGGEPPAEIQEAFAKRFRLPELEQTLDGKVAPEKRRSTQDPGPAPKGVRIEELGGVTWIWVDPGSIGRMAVWALWLALPLAIGYLVYNLEPSMSLMAAGMVTAFAALQIVLAEIAWRRKRRNQQGICIGGRAIWLGRPGEEPGLKITADELSQVRLDRAKRQGGAAMRIVVEGGGKRIELSSSQLNQNRLEWIRDKVLHLAYRLE